MNRLILRRRNALFCVPFFVCGVRGLRSGGPDSPIVVAEADHPVGWTKKRLKSDLEPLNLTSQVHEVTSSVYEPATSVHLVTSKHDNLISFALEHESMNNNKK